MSYSEAINYLYDLQKYGIKLGLENINQLMSNLANPHLSFLSVHVGGTNGKGSTSAIIASILQIAGLKVGLFTSPHLINFTERIKINGEEISEDEVICLTNEIKEIASKIKEFYPTFFEMVTAIAMLHFKRKNIDIAVIEVGMGGRLDATNIIMPMASVITNISYDHKEFLGRTLKEIAFEKAGIIKNGVPVVVSNQDSEVKDIIIQKTKEKDAELHIYGRDFLTTIGKENLFGIDFDYLDTESELRDLFLPLMGSFQIQNASVAIKTVRLLSKKIQNNLDDEATRNSWEKFIREGLKNLKWSGRLEFIEGNPPVLIDGAHNPAAAEAISRTIKNVLSDKFKKIIIVLGIMSDKDINGIMKPLLNVASEIILTSPAYSRAASPENLAEIAESTGFFNLKISPTVKDALEKAKETALSDNDSSVVVITGSFYTIGEAKEALGSKGILTTLRE